MLMNSKRLVAVMLALIICLSMPLATLAEEVLPEMPIETSTLKPTEEVKEVVETTPPAEEQTTPPAEEQTTPPAEEQTTPPAEETATTSPEASISPEASVSPEPSVTPELEVKAVQPADVNLTIGQSQQLYLEGEYTQRCYVTFAQSGYFTLDVQIGSTNPDSRATVRFVSSSFTTTYLSGTMTLTNKVHLGDWFDVGTYCVLISLDAASGDYFSSPISYTISTAFEATSAVSGNGDWANARDLGLNTSYTAGLLSRTNNASWWKITLSSAGRLEIGLKSYVSDVDAYVLQLRNGQRTRHYIDMSVSGGTDTSPQYCTNSDWLEAGVYYLCVNGMDSNTGLYGVMATFTAANNAEGNNESYLTATNLTVNGGAMRCLLSQTDEIDIFSFTLSTRTTVTITAKAYMSALNLQMFNANMRIQLSSASASGTDGTLNKPHNHTVTQTLNAGTYTILVSRDPEGPRGVFTIEVNSELTIAAINLNDSVLDRGKTVVASCVTSGKTPVRFAYQLQKQNATGSYDNVGASVESTSNVYSIIPGPGVDANDTTGTGVYRFEVRAADGYVWTRAFSDPFTYKNTIDLAVSGLYFDRTTLTTSETITFTVGVRGGTGLKQTTFYIYDAVNGIRVNSVTVSGNAGSYQPKKSGRYSVMVVVTDGTSWASAWGTQDFVVNPLQITQVALSREGTTSVNYPLMVTCSYANAVPTAWVYEVYCQTPSDTGFNFIERFSSTSQVFVYTPKLVGKYRIMAVANDGSNWASCWSPIIDSISAAPLNIEKVTPSATNVNCNEMVNFSISYAGGSTVQHTEYQLYDATSNVIVNRWSGNSDTHGFAIASPGTYRVMAVASDGTTWVAKFSDRIVVSSTPVTPLTITSLTANKSSIDTGDVVEFTFNIGSGTPVQYDYYIYSESNTLICAVPTHSAKWSYTFNTSGTYKVMGVVTDGQNWASAWSTPSQIVVKARLAITTVNVDSTIKTYPQSIVVTPVLMGGKSILQMTYEVFNAATNQCVSTWSGKSGFFTFIPTDPSITSYRIMVIATDGSEWASKFSDFVNYTKPAKLQITAITSNTSSTPASIELGQSLTFHVATTGGAALRSTEFQVYRLVGSTETLVDRMSGNSTSFTFIPNTSGKYRVMFVAFDGIDWVAKYSDYVEVIEPTR